MIAQRACRQHDERETPVRIAPGHGVVRSRNGVTVLPRPVEQASRRPHIALYSHDTMGLGHMRRSMLIAQAMAESDVQPNVLLIAGAHQAAAFSLPDGVDCLTLPALHKSESGNYSSRQLRMPLPDLIALRSSLIQAALDAFQPDMLVVDNVPRGAVRELDPVLAELRRQSRTHIVLGLRDVLDEPEVVQREWSRAGNLAAIRELYDEVWVYGDAAIYDPVREYGLPDDIAARVRYVGYLNQSKRLNGTRPDAPHPFDALDLPPGELALCMVGGGQDGAQLASAFSRIKLPEGMNGVILTGPYMPDQVRQELHARAREQPRLRVLEFLAEPCRIWERADRVVMMGGYNSVCEALSFGTPTLIVPRVVPRREQIIRAERLRDLGLLDMLHPEAVSPQALAAWLARPTSPTLSNRATIDLDGLERLPGIVNTLLSDTRAAGWDGADSEGVHHAAM